MQDKRYATCFNIYGEEYWVYTVKTNDTFNIDLYYGNPVDGLATKPKLILTEGLKTFLSAHEDVHPTEFGEYLSMNTIKKLRRELKKNPYKSYEDWLRSDDKDKPKMITFLDRKNNPEFLTDYFGDIYVLASATFSEKTGIALPKGTKKEIYFSNNPKEEGKRHIEYIATKEIVDFVRKHRYNFELTKEKLSSRGSMVKFLQKIRKSLGYDGGVLGQIDMWVAAHLKEIYSMSCAKFIAEYAHDMHIGKGDVIVNFKTNANNLAKYKKSNKRIFETVRLLDDGVSENEVKKALQCILPKSRGELIKPYRILMLAREHKYEIPKALKGILKKSKT